MNPADTNDPTDANGSADAASRLSRRKLLGGIGAIGVASAGAGLGTTAFFSDEASFEGNELEAGRLELSVNYEFAADQGIRNEQNPYWGQNGGGESGVVSSTPDDPATVSYRLDDVKPGDTGWLRFAFVLDDNPAYLWACGNLTGNAQNGVTDPERVALLESGLTEGEIDASKTDPWGGQLADALVADLVYRDALSGAPIGDPIASGSLREVLAALTNGIPLDQDGDPEAGLARACYPDGSSVTALGIVWSLPPTVGNEVQTDSVGFDLSFHAEQCRHNDGETNPCVAASTGGGYGVDRLARDPVWFARARNGAPNVNDQLLVGNAPANDGDYDATGVAWPDPTAAELTVTHDAGDGDLTIAVDNGVSGTVTYAGTLADATVSGGSNAILITAKAGSGSTAAVSDVRLNGAQASGASAVSSDDDPSGYAHLLIDDVDATADWVLTADVTLEGVGGGSQELPAVDVNVA
ncbi:SipW-dependent-type signal peptide-containing protein [Halorubrum sp. JWXQ-INN 858]|uniref:SipW-dependent-type signal peptide-containing protein n=1 Tax=Halorubrum sp. JWXQ-INN 858 TaxID=2690782 RepID=UPI001F4295BD|nr:SipW-dependent-type signal peptide-containing protein [Halorubrum sp. JWXQ-INN 858]